MEAPRDSIIQDVKRNIEDIDKKILEAEERSTASENSVFIDTIEHSQWSPENRVCSKARSFKANMPAYILPGESSEERIKYVQWILGKNHHIKAIKEVFKKGNNWVEVDFDCEHSHDIAMNRIQEKEGEWLKLIPEEEKNKSPKPEQQDSSSNRKEEERQKKQQKKEKFKEQENTFITEEETNTYSYFIIWDFQQALI